MARCISESAMISIILYSEPHHAYSGAAGSRDSIALYLSMDRLKCTNLSGESAEVACNCNHVSTLISGASYDPMCKR